MEQRRKIFVLDHALFRIYLVLGWNCLNIKLNFDKLELWEIKLYGEKQEKLTAAQVLPITRTSTGKLPPTRNITSSSGDLSNSSTPTSNGNSAPGSSLANKSAIISSKASREEIN
ncbi:uncharacterized protein LOC129770238 [Toxorhynchites rutilus septentrionalis]|uniref:uncharacterized protein LOC129770238 n=1 Tax=Toxorhynchites rutilus septentrionalis TaxID=329112 RepID=UPI002479EE18|nr:uncharacterized protein LOC129770238 [Toxorhynchites rutilus septentrionalis]